MATPAQGPVASRDQMIYRRCERLCRRADLQGGGGNDRVPFGERRRFGCSHIFYVFGLKLSESGNWCRSGVICGLGSTYQVAELHVWGAISRIG